MMAHHSWSERSCTNCQSTERQCCSEEDAGSHRRGPSMDARHRFACVCEAHAGRFDLHLRNLTLKRWLQLRVPSRAWASQALGALAFFFSAPGLPAFLVHSDRVTNIQRLYLPLQQTNFNFSPLSEPQRSPFLAAAVKTTMPPCAAAKLALICTHSFWAINVVIKGILLKKMFKTENDEDH